MPRPATTSEGWRKWAIEVKRSRAAAEGAAAWILRAHAEGRVAGVIALGGSAGTTIGTAAMRALPLGMPKLMVSTLASGQVRHYVGDKDILMLNSVVDLSGLNRITNPVLDAAARAMAGMVLLPRTAIAGSQRPLIAATMFGVTTPCVEQATAVLERAGYEVLVFHATGSGGQTMESLIDEGLFAGVLDVTTTELADELLGGFLSAGPQRLTAAAKRGVPQVVSVGATDMVNFHAPASVPDRFRGRHFYHHNPNVTLMRTTVEESAWIGAEIGRKLSVARGPLSVLLPARGVSAIDRAGQPFDDPAARQALFSAFARRGRISTCANWIATSMICDSLRPRPAGCWSSSEPTRKPERTREFVPESSHGRDFAAHELSGSAINRYNCRQLSSHCRFRAARPRSGSRIGRHPPWFVADHSWPRWFSGSSRQSRWHPTPIRWQ